MTFGLEDMSKTVVHFCKILYPKKLPCIFQWDCNLIAACDLWPSSYGEVIQVQMCNWTVLMIDALSS